MTEKTLEKKSLWNEAKMKLIAGLIALPIMTSTIGYVKTSNFINDANSQESKKIRAELVKESFQDRNILSKAYFLGDYFAANKYLQDNQ